MSWSPRKLKEKVGENGEKICSNIWKEEKRVAVAHFRAIVEKQDPDCKEIDELTLGRFLRAADLDVEKGCSKLMKYLKWRQSFVPNGSISASQIQNQIAQNKVFMQGVDKRGCPITLVFLARHFPCKGGDEYKRFLVYFLDKLCSRIPDGEESFTVIEDLQGYGLANTDVNGFIESLSMLQDYYPERLRKLFFVHAPYIFMTTWKIIYPFVDKSLRKKIIFVEKKKINSTLLEEIDEDQLPEIYGGKLKLIPIQDA